MLQKRVKRSVTARLVRAGWPTVHRCTGPTLDGMLRTTRLKQTGALRCTERAIWKFRSATNWARRIYCEWIRPSARLLFSSGCSLVWSRIIIALITFQVSVAASFLHPAPLGAAAGDLCLARDRTQLSNFDTSNSDNSNSCFIQYLELGFLE